MSKGIYIPDITVEMFRNAPLEGVEELLVSGVMRDIEVSEDCISTAYLEQEIENQTMTVNEEYWRGWNNALGKVVELIEDAPSVIPSRPKGVWIEQEDDYHHYWECSECGMGVGLDDIRNYCPHCGADMKGASNET